MATEHRIPVDAVVALSARLLEEGDLDSAMHHVCAATVEHVTGADEASITMMSERGPTTYGATGGLPVAADERQYEAGTGPCLDAISGNQTLVVDDVDTDPRWPHLLPMLAEAGVRSVLSVPLPVQDAAIAGLNIYSRRREGFDAQSRELAESLAGFAAVAVSNAHSYAKVAEEARNMHEAMASRAVIEQAKGIIMGRVGCDADAAFGLLIQQSQHENRKLRDIALELVLQASRKV